MTRYVDPGRPKRWSFSQAMFALGRVLFIVVGVLAAVVAFDPRRPGETRLLGAQLLLVVVFSVGGYVLGRRSPRRP